MQPVLEKEYSEFEPAELCLKLSLCHILSVVECLCKYIHMNKISSLYSKN